MRKLFLTLALTTSILSAQNLLAQDTHKDGHNVKVNVPKVALLDLEADGSKTITLAPTAPDEAGEFLDFSKANNKDLWINYSSVIGRSGNRKVVVKITDGQVPGGMDLFVTADKPQHGKGNLGEPTGKVLISRTGKDLIKGIGSCYTDDGPRKGHRLNYELRLSKESNSVSKVNFDHSNTLTITYTLTDN